MDTNHFPSVHIDLTPDPVQKGLDPKKKRLVRVTGFYFPKKYAIKKPPKKHEVDGAYIEGHLCFTKSDFFNEKLNNPRVFLSPEEEYV